LKFSAVLALLVLTVVAFEASLGVLPGLAVKPNLTVVFTIFFALRLPPTRGGVAAFAMGYLRDLLSGGIVGASALLMLLLYIAARALAAQFFSRPYAFVLPLVAGGTFGAGAGYFVIVQLVGAGIDLPVDFGRRLLLDTVVTTAAAVPLWWALDRLHHLLLPPRTEEAA